MINLYQILGISETATQQEIKQAYRRLAMKYHPDSGGSQASEAMFTKVNKAYQILSVPARRRWYDTRYRTQSTVNSRQQERYYRARAAARYYYAQKASRKQEMLWHRKDFLIAALSLMIIILSFMFFNDLRYVMIKRHASSTVAVIYSPYSFGGDSKNLHYGYVVDDSLYTQHDSEPTSPGTDIIITDDGIPLSRGYEFRVWYNPDRPERGIIDLSAPMPKTLIQVKKEAAKILHVREGFTPYQAECMVVELYEKQGLNAIGDILCSEFYWYQNLWHNKSAFRKLQKSSSWKESLEKCSFTD
jgi:curved DNA-binding protein CbpA